MKLSDKQWRQHWLTMWGQIGVQYTKDFEASIVFDAIARMQQAVKILAEEFCNLRNDIEVIKRKVYEESGL